MLSKKKNILSIILALLFTLNTTSAFNVQALENAMQKKTLKKVTTAKKPAKSKKNIKTSGTIKNINSKKPVVKLKPKTQIKKANKKIVKVPVKKTDSTAEILNNIKNYIDEDNIMKIINDLSSKKFDGRATGTAGNSLAADYIAGYFKKIGLNCPNGVKDFRNYYKQDVGILNSTPILDISDSSGKVTSYKYRIDFSPSFYYQFKLKGDITKELYNLKSKDDLIKNVNVLKNKILLISTSTKSQIPELTNLIVSSGLNVIVESNNESTGGHYLSAVYHPVDVYKSENSGLYFNANTNTFNALTTAANHNEMCHMALDMTVKNVQTANIIGILPGNSPKLKNEYIILSSHFDHVGDNFDGTYNGGAFDNASGTAAIMEIARVLKQKNLKPDKTIVFAAFNGEETGLVGSKEFVKSSLIDFKHAVDIQFDMIGFKGNEPYKIYGGYNKPTASKFKDEIAALFNNNSIECETGDYPASDHASFADAGIPSVLVIDEILTTYHSPNDKVETLDKHEIKDIIALTFKYIFSNSCKKPFNYTSSLSNNINLTDYKDKINKENIAKIIKDLSSAEYDGREIGTEGNDKTVKYITDYFSKLGLNSLPGTKDYIQEYDKYILENNNTPVFEVLDKDKTVIKRFNFEKDFCVLCSDYSNIKGDFTSNIVIPKSSENLLSNLNNYKGKIMLLSISMQQKLTNAERQQIFCSGVNIIYETPCNSECYLKSIYSGTGCDASSCGLIFEVNTSAFKEISDAADSNKLCHIFCDYTLKKVKLANVYAVIPGTDETLKNEYLLLCANLDGYGHNSDGTYNPSALFNASGIAGILETARVIKENNLAPKQTIVIAAFNSGALGYDGLDEFLKSPNTDLSKTTAIDFFGIGNKTTNNGYYIEGNVLNSSLSKFFKILDAEKIKYYYSKTLQMGAKVYNNYQVAALEVVTQDISNYCCPKDISDNVDKEKIEDFINCVLNYIF